eukprot:gene22127-29188_t
MAPLGKRGTGLGTSTKSGGLGRRAAAASTADGDGDETNPLHELRRQLAERDAELLDLQQDFEMEQRKVLMVESELRLSVGAMRKAEEAHGEEMDNVQGDIKQVMAERRTLVEKLNTIETVEDAVRELYVQMKDRIAQEGTPIPEQLQREKEALKSESILVVLGRLHAVLKNLWAFKVETEDDREFECSIETDDDGGSKCKLQTRLNCKVEAEDDLREKRLGRSHRQTEDTSILEQKTLDAETEARCQLMDESEAALHSMSSQHQELLSSLKSAVDEGTTVKKSLEQAHAEGKRRDGLVLANRKLESARHFDRVGQDRELRTMEVEHHRQMSIMEAELYKMSDLMAQNQTLEVKLRRANDVLNSFRQDVGLKSAYSELEQQCCKLETDLRDERESNQNQVYELEQQLRAMVKHDRLKRGSSSALRASTSSLPVGRLRPGTAPGRETQRAPPSASHSQYSSKSMSMANQAKNIMNGLRSKAHQEEQTKIEKEEAAFHSRTLADVTSLHRQAKGLVREVNRELHDDPRNVKERMEAGAPQITKTLEELSEPPKGCVGLTGTNPTAISVNARMRDYLGSVAQRWAKVETDAPLPYEKNSAYQDYYKYVKKKHEANASDSEAEAESAPL